MPTLGWIRCVEIDPPYNTGNHYPDFIGVTKRSNVLIVESKGDDRKNCDSAQKLKLGQAWEKKAEIVKENSI
jgi:hypothetical protein